MNEIEQMLRSLSDDEKIHRLENENNYYYIKILVMSLSSDELKLQMIDKLNDNDKANLVKSLESDDLKMLYLKNREKDIYRKIEIIKSIKLDELKVQALSLFEEGEDYYKQEIIMTLQSDEKKIYAMKKYIASTYYYVEIIKSFTLDENKIDNLNLIYSPYQKKEILESIKVENDEQRLRVAILIKDDNLASKYIKEIEDEKKKKEAIELLSDDFAKIEVIITLKEDASKIEELEKLSNDITKAKVIITLQDDASKIEQLGKLSDDLAKTDVIITLQDDASKIEQLEKISKEMYKAKVIVTLQDDSIKIEQLEKLNDDFVKADVIISLQDDSIKIEQLEQLSNDLAKGKVISTLRDDISKIEQLEKLNDDFAKAEVIITLKDDLIKIEQLKKLSNDLAKGKVIIELEDDIGKTEQLEQLGDDFVKAIFSELIQIKKDEILPETILPESILADRGKLKEKLLDDDRTYKKIGLDENITIGMEIESEGVMSLELQLLNAVIKKQSNGKTREWEAKGDGSLERGVEIVSPILKDDIEDVEDIYIVCAMMKKCKQEITERCGGHIHIGADYLKSKEAYVNLFEIWGNAEKIICKISNEKENIPRGGIQTYAAPISSKLNEAIEKETINLESEEDLDKFISEIQEVQGNRYSGLNLLNINNGKNTIEFRISNGTINADTWIENARLFGRIIQISQRLAEIEKQTELSEEDRKMLDLKSQLKEEVSEQEKMEMLLELLFSEEERKVYRERYISNSTLLEQIPDEKNPFQATEFSRVDFKKKKHTLGEFQEIAVGERAQDINETIRQTIQWIRTEWELEQANDRNMEEK